MGHVIRAYRQHVYHGHRGLTQDVVAGWAGITQGQLSTIESGPPINDLGRLISWALLLGIPEQYLWFKLPGGRRRLEVASRPALDGLDVVVPQVSASLHESSLAAERAAAIGVDLWDLLDALEATKVSKSGLALAEEASTRLDTQFVELAPTVLLPELRRQLAHVVGWLKQSQPVAFRQRLSTLAGRLAGLRAWLYFDMAELDAANAWFEAAVRAAQEAGNHDLCGYLLGAQSLIPTDGADHRGAAHLINRGQEFAKRGSDTTRAWLDVLDARTHAAQGDSRGFTTLIRFAEKRLPRTAADESRHGMDFAGDHLDPTYYQGMSHLLLDEPQLAGEAFDAALHALAPGRVKARAILLLSRSIAFGQAQELDRAAATATEALTIAGDQPIGRVRQRADDLRQMLGPKSRSAAVRDFDERLTAFAGTLQRATAETST